MYELDALSPSAMFIASNSYSVATHEMILSPRDEEPKKEPTRKDGGYDDTQALPVLAR